MNGGYQALRMCLWSSRLRIKTCWLSAKLLISIWIKRWRSNLTFFNDIKTSKKTKNGSIQSTWFALDCYCLQESFGAQINEILCISFLLQSQSFYVVQCASQMDCLRVDGLIHEYWGWNEFLTRLFGSSEVHWVPADKSTMCESWQWLLWVLTGF
jgi:hypothetical protein